jgi:hypothetical protein
MNDVFFDYLNEFVSTYINDILIYNNSKTKHIEHVKKMLQRLRNVELQTDINKCDFFVHEIKYLDLIMKRNEIKMKSKKIEIILQWTTSQNLKQIQNFFEFCCSETRQRSEKMKSRDESEMRSDIDRCSRR